MGSRDQYWLSICDAIAAHSKCLSRKIGAVIVKEDKYIVSTGYNGPPSNCKSCSNAEYRSSLFARYSSNAGFWDEDCLNICPRRIMGFESGGGLQFCSAAHAERNAIDIAARLGHSTEGLVMYMNCNIPCMECAKSIVNSGIKEIVVKELIPYEKEGITGLDILLWGKVGIRRMELNG